MRKVSIVGEGHLADATAKNCEKWFTLCPPHEADLVWYCVDTPVNEYDESDVDYVKQRLRWTLYHTNEPTPVLISSQVPVGFCRSMELEFPRHHLAIQPENIRKNRAFEDFACQDRIIVGSRYRLTDGELIYEIVSRFVPNSGRVIFMTPESAEMTKHALNSFMALNITFANEIAAICRKVGASVEDVTRGFRSDSRVGNGPLMPGDGYRGGTLGRDVVVLNNLEPGPVLSAIKHSNDLMLAEVDSRKDFV